MGSATHGHMKKVGVTGGIGSGKSTVCDVLRVLGVPVFHADHEAKLLYGLPEVRNAVIAAFGEAMYVGDVVDRKDLADRVFTTPPPSEAQCHHPSGRAQALPRVDGGTGRALRGDGGRGPGGDRWGQGLRPSGGGHGPGGTCASAG